MQVVPYSYNGHKTVVVVVVVILSSLRGVLVDQNFNWHHTAQNLVGTVK